MPPAPRTAVVAVGGNALTRPGESGTSAELEAAADVMAVSLAALRGDGWGLAVVHGNGPQVGALALQQDAARELTPVQPLHALCAMTQGQLGGLLARAVNRRAGAGSSVALVTHVVVDPDDPAFQAPTKPIGPFFPEAQARELAAERDWTVAEDSGRGWRRVVPSPAPAEVLELEAVRTLLATGLIVLAGGGGGIAVCGDGSLRGLDAVIDKDATAALLATALGVDELHLLTGVDAVLLDHGTAQQREVHDLTAEQAREHLAAGQFPPGSMGPKVAAALAFLDAGGSRAVITSAARLSATLAGDPDAGTRIHA